MSAPPRPGGPAANGPNGAPRAPFIRRVQNSDPMRPRQKPRPKPAQSLPPKQNNQEQSSKEDVLDKEIAADFAAKIKVLQQQRAKNNGWSDRPSENIQDYPLVITKKSLLEGIRHHVMRLHKLKGDDDVDLTNQDQFPRPVTLHRRDPRLPPAHRMVVKEEPASLDPSEAAEAERLKQAKADKEAQRALDQAQIAPVTRETNPKPKQNNKKDKATAFYGKHSDAHKKQSGIRYEETLPWHLEDAEGRSGTWVGSYVASLSDTHVGLVIDGSRFRMIPLERWYRFDEKPKFETMSLDAAEKLMYEVKDVKRWVMKDKDRELLEKERAETRRFLSGPARVKTESETSRAARRNERQDDFELDISGDEFQDDDETPGFEADDEDAKDSKERIRREQNAANLFGEGEESKVEQEEREKELEKLRRKMIGKQTIKGLTKYEQAMEYEDDSSDNSNNPFTDSSDSEDSDEEVKKEEEEKKPQVASGSNTKGNTTPSKNAAKKGKLKRPGSPAISESSDNENARKKIKTGKSGSVVPSRGGTPIPGRPKVLGGATSDGEATGGEGSDGGALLKKKLKMKAAAAGARPGGTPSGSRAGSPAPPGQASASSSFNNRNSATPGIGSPPPSGAATGNGVGKVTAAEIVSVLARFPDGVSLSALIRMFANRIDKPGHISKKEWISLVKANAAFGPDKLMRPKTGGSANGGSTSMGQAA